MASVLYEQHGLPTLQNRVYESAEAARTCATASVRLEHHQETGIVTNALFDHRVIRYDASYDNEQSHSDRFQRHLDQVASIIESTTGTHNLVEIGCGKGTFLERMSSRGWDIQGFDAAYEGDNPRIQKRFFDPAIRSRANALILRHVLEHIEAPHKFLRSIAEANSGKGLIYIEVPSLEWIIAKNAWWDIFYEHVNYFRLLDFGRLFSNVISAGTLFGDQYLYCVADLASLSAPSEHGPKVTFGRRFGDIDFKPLHGRRWALWGCASKGVVFSLLAQRAGCRPEAAIDINPAKQRKHLPVTGIQILSPASAMETIPAETVIIVMNSEYLDEVRNLVGQRFTCESLETLFG